MNENRATLRQAARHYRIAAKLARQGDSLAAFGKAQQARGLLDLLLLTQEQRAPLFPALSALVTPEEYEACADNVLSLIR